ncbi:hypothetical protein KEM60_02943 [Austwickia sp. TVS 96-490-7B]|uniref:pyridoxamine 5'-phosphate oxidase family protein n=1 Tax=Austwickia sp. TVS 96-490-7B TaxID=2830843 RepID=UPI001C59958D|nr:pyridoxamine 5'-phosphate oxidase family protein [Austwickia sp. TVS 96-490-7B]MBW3086714.1 hypothetical protein [Austwickia sp. TVS 96-490-7B]
MNDTTPVRSDPGAMTHVADLIKGQRVAMIATLDHGTIVSRPLACQDAPFDGTVWFFCRASSALATQIDTDGACNVSYSSDGAWVSLAGHGEIVRDVARNEEFWGPFAQAYFGTSYDDPDVVLLKVTADTAEYWDSPGKVAQLVSVVTALATGGTAASGDNAVVEMPQFES